VRSVVPYVSSVTLHALRALRWMLNIVRRECSSVFRPTSLRLC